MNKIVLIAPAWGFTEGGINAFNYDLAIALAKEAEQNGKVLCFSISRSSNLDLVHNANVAGVALSDGIVLDEKGTLDYEKLYATLKIEEKDDLYFIGHDVFTGRIAKNLSQQFIGRVNKSIAAVIHHMDYSSYDSYKKGNKNGHDLSKKINDQVSTLANSDIVFTVGPKLRKSAKDKLLGSGENKIYEITPGMQSITVRPMPEVFSAISFGRYDDKIDPVKQMGLAVASFAKAKNDDIAFSSDQDAKIKIVGSGDVSAEEAFKTIAGHHYKGASCINSLPYLTERAPLFNTLSGSSVSLMLSLHEGFGLTGLEAIAAGVPLIISKNTGLFESIKNSNKEALHLLYPVQITGTFVGNYSFSPEDVDHVSQQLLSIYHNQKEAKKNAEELRELLLKQYTWSNAARTVIRKLLNHEPGEKKSGAINNSLGPHECFAVLDFNCGYPYRIEVATFIAMRQESTPILLPGIDTKILKKSLDYVFESIGVTYSLEEIEGTNLSDRLPALIDGLPGGPDEVSIVIVNIKSSEIFLALPELGELIQQLSSTGKRKKQYVLINIDDAQKIIIDNAREVLKTFSEKGSIISFIPYPDSIRGRAPSIATNAMKFGKEFQELSALFKAIEQQIDFYKGNDKELLVLKENTPDIGISFDNWALHFSVEGVIGEMMYFLDSSAKVEKHIFLTKTLYPLLELIKKYLPDFFIDIINWSGHAVGNQLRFCWLESIRNENEKAYYSQVWIKKTGFSIRYFDGLSQLSTVDKDILLQTLLQQYSTNPQLYKINFTEIVKCFNPVNSIGKKLIEAINSNLDQAGLEEMVYKNYSSLPNPVLDWIQQSNALIKAGKEKIMKWLLEKDISDCGFTNYLLFTSENGRSKMQLLKTNIAMQAT